VERDEALAEGVHFLILTQPVDYAADERGRLEALVVMSTLLGEPDEGGRRRPVAQPESRRALPVDLVVEALGQQISTEMRNALKGVELTRGGLVAVDEQMQTAREGVFAGGDLVNGGATVAQAVGEGFRAAEGMGAYLRHRPR
jgi:glutamate synthase (NADPH/NADH) small chain